MRIKYDRRIEGKNAWLDANAVEDSPSLPLLLQLLQVQLVLPYGTGDQALLAMAAALYESDIELLPTVEPGTVQVRYDATAAASLFSDAPSGEVGIVWIEASKLDSPQSLSLDTPEATYYPLQLQGDSMSFKGLPRRHYMDDSMEVADKTVLYYCRCYFRASSTAEPLYDTVHSFSVQGLADNAYVYDRRYAADPFVLYPWLSDSFREAHGIGPIGYIAVEDTYSSRETADGADIIDGALETVKKIQGATVKTVNQFDISKVDSNDGEVVVEATTGRIQIGVTTPAGYPAVNYDIGILSELIPNAIVGNRYTIFATYSGLDRSTNAGNIAIMNGVRMLITPKGTDGTYSDSFIIQEGDLDESTTIRIMSNESISAKDVSYYVTIVIVEGDQTSQPAPAYSPYFPGLKNAYFKGLRSTGRNLYTYAGVENNADQFANCTEVEVLDGGNVLIAKGNESTNNFQYNSGWVRPNNGNTQYYLNLYKVANVNISADITLIEQGSRSAEVRCYLYYLGNVGNIAPTNSKAITSTKTRYTWTLSLTNSGLAYPIFAINSNKVQIENISVSYTEETNGYEPYISNEISLDTAIELPAWDSINPTTGKRIVQSNTLTFDGTESNWQPSLPVAENVFSIARDLGGKNGTGNAFMNSTIRVGLPYNSPNDNAGCYLTNAGYSGILVWFRQSAYPNVTDLASAKAQLAAWNTAGDPLTVCYQTATATESDISMEDRLPAYKSGSETVIQGDTDNSEYGAENTLTQEYYNLEVNDNE